MACRTLVLTPAEWCRLTCQIQTEEHDTAARTQMLKEREHIRQRTQEMSQHWNDTVQHRHERIIKAHEEAKRAAEEDRVIQDEQEQMLQEEKKKTILERAKLLKFYDNDQVRKLNSALLYSDVLRERQLQIELKRKNQPLPETFDFYTHSKLIEEESLNRKKCAVEKKKLVKEALLKQIEEKKSKERYEKCLSWGQARSNVMEALDCKALLRKQLEAAQPKKMKCREEILKQIKSNQNYEQARRYKDEEDTKRAELYYEGKERMKCLLKIKDLNRIKTRQSRQEEVGRHLRALEETNAVEAKEELSRLRCQQQQDHRWEQRQREEHCRHQNAAKERLQDYETAVADKIRNKMAAKLEGVDIRREADEALAHQLKQQERKRVDKLKQKKLVGQDLLQQMREKEEDNPKLPQQHLEELLAEDAKIQQYAQSLLKERCGRQNVIPIILAARPGIGQGLGRPFPEQGNIRPQYQSAVEGHELPSFKHPPAIAPLV